MDAATNISTVRPTGEPTRPHEDTVDLREHAEEIVWAATRAPSYRDTQPWSFRVKAHQVEVYADLSRSWPVTDPQDRQLFLSVGAAVFGVRLALSRLGVRPVVGLSRDPSRRELAAVVVSAGPSHAPAEEDQIYAELARRRTVAASSLHGPLPRGLRTRLTDVVRHEGVSSRWVDRATDRGTISDLLRRTAVAPTPKIGTTSPIPPADDSLSLLVVCTPADHPADWLRAGQALHHVLLLASADGFAAVFLNELLEIPLLRERLRVQLGLPGRPQVVLGLGRPDDPAPPPAQRRPLTEVLRPE